MVDGSTSTRFVTRENTSKSEDEEFEYNEEDYNTSKELIKLRIKASLANNLWGVSEFYEIYNAKNEILQTAIEIIESDKYKEANLAE